MADRLSVQGDLVLEDVHGDGLVSLCGMRLTGHLRCTGSELLQPAGKAFNGRGMAVGGSALFDGGFRSAGEFILASARIDGSVDMTGASISNEGGAALMADGIRVGTGLLLSAGSSAAFSAEGTVRLAEARIAGKLKCSGGHFCALPMQDKAIDAQLIEADEVCLDDGFMATGEVCLDGSTVKGRVSCERGKFCNPRGTALRANGLDCRDLRLGRGFAAAGKVELIGGRISRELNCSKGKFFNQKSVALIADGLICDGKIYFNDEFVACGEIWLHNARIRTELNCTSGAVSVLRAGGITCDGTVYLNDKFWAGEVELMDATVGRELNCKDGKFGRFDAQRLTVDGKFDWRPSQVPETVDVSFASVGLLLDDLNKSWPKAEKNDDPKTKLIGFTFRDLEEGGTGARGKEDPTGHRISWLNYASYAPDAYRQLTRIYRQKGLDREARKIAIAGQRDRRDRGGMPLASRLWSGFLDVTVRYGYGMYRPLLIVLFAGFAGTVFFYLAQVNGIMEAVSGSQGAPVDANKCTSAYPCFFPLTYAFEILLPVINLRQVNFWLPSGATGWGRVLLVWVWIAIASGWVITVAVAAGIGHLFSERD